MTHPTDILLRRLERLRAVPDRWRKEVLVIALPAVQNASPVPGNAHPYATGEFSDSWQGREEPDARVVVENTADHAIYTEGGYTRYGGAGSARTWPGEPYAETALEAVSPAIRDTTERLIREALNG